MRLLLDEMLPTVIAEQLRRRGRDVVAVHEKPELRGASDAEIFEHAQSEERAVVMYNRDDFLELDRRYRGQARNHHGIVVLHPRRFPQRQRTIGALVTSLAAFAGEDAPYAAFVHWLR